MRVLNPGWRRWPSFADIYPNYKLVPRIGCPLLVMHVSTQFGGVGVAVGRAGCGHKEQGGE
jgi:hypothetical protein